MLGEDSETVWEMILPYQVPFLCSTYLFPAHLVEKGAVAKGRFEMSASRVQRKKLMYNLRGSFLIELMGFASVADSNGN